MMTFQSTLPRGERRPLCVSRTNMLRFQSTLPRGERLSERSGSCFNGEFQSTLPRGERRAKKRKNCHWYVFQSTLPRGERLRLSAVPVYQKDFNPRSHEGSDHAAVCYGKISHISIHAPTRGATAIFAKKFSFLSAKIV